MSEGGLKPPTRHPIDWKNPDFTDENILDAELRRVFDICHGCRRCFNLCDSFPRLFDLIDQSPTEELDSVDSSGFQSVVDACTLCDLCYMTKCPYVPPHEFNVDFPHLMLRHRVTAREKSQFSKVQDELVKTDRNGGVLTKIAPLVNWANSTDNVLTRPLMEKTVGIHREAAIPKFAGSTWMRQTKEQTFAVNEKAPAFGRKAVIFATCFCNYNNPNIGISAQKILHHNGIETEVVYPGCCGMPSLENGDLKKVEQSALQAVAALMPWIERGYDVIAPIPSCALMIKGEWPLLLPNHEGIKKLSSATWDISHYIVNFAQSAGLAPGLKPLGENITLHIACHARVQNVGQKAAEMLRLIPDLTVDVVERCSGHGGTWGMMVDHFDIALKVGQPVAQKVIDSKNRLIASECPLAASHIQQGVEHINGNNIIETRHPLEIMAQAFGL